MFRSRFADLNVKAEDVDPRSRKRTVEMRVLVLGFPRTGTSSIQKALEDLGFGPCYHMRTAINGRPRDCELWTELFRTKFDAKGTINKDDFDHLLGDCVSVCDLPACAFGPELMEAYPDAKVILTTRSEDSWYKSLHSSLLQSRYYWLHSVLARIDWVTYLVHTMRKETWRCMFDDDFEANGKRSMREHYDAVRQKAKLQNRPVLEFSASEGYGPLCEFLEVDLPKESYPHMNEGDQWIIKMRHRAWRRLYFVTMSVLPTILSTSVLAGGLLWGVLRYRRSLGKIS